MNDILKKLWILETAFKTIQNSLEWSSASEDNSHTMFIDGVVSMTETMLDSLNKPECPEKCE